MKVDNIQRAFKFKVNGKETIVDDPAPEYSPAEVMNFLSNQYPSLLNATVEEQGVEEGKLVYEFKESVGKKG